ncbi:homoserine kinase [bacterium M00.F.Ca.ET.194.01.1.1]|nr:homoserine kinase [bacterium M00.F.Ca.ET.194.01.1.1]TGS52617.1 homoserine kinase [bacterium M00.F.Ca.ET.179.01.1.1]TGV44473.1 homoserine kinase [bacterium M00.F.Ca.ET.168.01.1.1]
MGVFTELGDADSLSIANAYNMKPLTSVIGIADGDTETTYLFRAGKDEFIVTLFENGAEPVDLERAFDTMDNLYAHGVPCPEPRRTLNGDATYRAADRLVAVVDYLPGSPTKTLDMPRAESLGGVMAQIHAVLARNSKRALPDLPSGSIHGALDQENVFFLGDDVINFRLRHEDVLVSEVADVIVGCTMSEDGSLDFNLAKALLRGYRAVRELSAVERLALPGYVLASAARFFARDDRRDHLLDLASSAHRSITPEIFN